MTLAPKEISGRHVLYMMLGFFATVTAVNLVFVFFALSGFSGLDTEDAYQKGLAYNETLQAADAQRALGWSAALEGRLTEGGPAPLRLSYRDAAGRPLDGMTVRAEIRRPVKEGHDFVADLLPLGPGIYGADVAVALKGQWDIRVTATDRAGQRHILEQRLWAH